MSRYGTDMHREFRKLLAKAKGVSEFPIALNVDIRGFSKWSGDSAESGLFIKKVYIRLIDEYFQHSSFFKATGDGLMVLFPVDEEDPQAAVRESVRIALDIVKKFPSITSGDSMINFPTPRAVGVGLARGPASRLVSGKKTLDYSGATLNLAARLMDLARPEGVVVDGRFGVDLLTPAVKKRFAEDRVYLRGIAPNTGTDIYFTKDLTTIPESAKKPLDVLIWGSGTVQAPRRNLDEFKGSYFVALDSVPKDPTAITCYVKHDKVTKSGRRVKGQWIRRDLNPDDFRYEASASGPVLIVEMPKVHAHLEKMGGRPSIPVEIKAEFIAE